MNNNAPSKQVLALVYLDHPELQELELEPQHLIFCIEYPVDFNGTQAAIRADYPVKNASQQSSVLLAQPNIIKAIQILTRKRLDDIQQTADIAKEDIVKGIKEVIQRCMQGKPVMIRVDGKMEQSGSWKFDAMGALRGWELLGKHKGMFVDKKEIKHLVSWEDRVKQIRGDEPEQKRLPIMEADVTPIEIKIDEDV